MTDGGLYDMIKDKQKKEYPVANPNKDFIKLLNDASDKQKANINEVRKQSFMEMETDGKQVNDLMLSNQLFVKCKFDGSIISKCKFIECDFIECTFNGCSIYNVLFDKCHIRNCDFTSTDMEDVNAQTSFKNNCAFDEIDPDKNVVGFDNKDINVIGDQVEQTGTSSEVIVKNCMEKYFKDWSLSQNNDAYQLLFPDDDNTGIALYQNTQKNTENSQVWELDLLIGNESILMEDFDLYQKTEDQVKEIIETFVEKTLLENSQAIVKNIIALLHKENIENDID